MAARSRTAAALALALAMPTSGAGQESAPDTAASALAAPLSAGSVALLLPHANAPGAVERLKDALADPRPDVRAVAARVAFTTRHAALSSALASALAKETSPFVAAEMVRALTLIGGAGADATTRQTFDRFDVRAQHAWVEAVSRMRPAELWARLAELPTDYALARALAAQAVAQPEPAAAAVAPLPQTPALEAVYVALVNAARRSGILPPWPVLAPGLATSGAPRLGVYLLLIDARDTGQTLPAEATSLLNALPTAGPEVAAAAVYAEVVRRTKRGGGTSMVGTIQRIDPATLPRTFLWEFALNRLDDEEAAALQKVAPAWKRADVPPAALTRRLGSERLDVDPNGSQTRLPRPLSNAAIKELQGLLGCVPTPGNVVVVDVTYRPTGQVRGVSIPDRTGGPCARAAGILSALEVAPGFGPVPEARVDRVVMGLRPSDLDCEREPRDRMPAPVRVSGTMKAPRKTRNVAPDYPASAIQKRVQGVVVVEASIPETGCVADAYVLRHVSPELDVSALASVSQWRYEPATVDGRTVPVIMTVTVNYALQ